MAKKKKTTTAVDVTDAGAEIGIPGELTAPTPEPGLLARNLLGADVTRYDLDMFVVDSANNLGRAPSDNPYSTPAFAEKKASIAEIGVIQPVLFSVNGDADHLVLRVGFQRFEAMRQLRAEHPDDPRYVAIPAIPLDGSPTAIDLLRAGLAENLQHASLNAIDKAHIASQFAATGMTQRAIAVEMGYKGAGQITKLLALLTLPQDLQERVRNGELDTEAAYHLSKASSETQEAAAVTLGEQPAETGIDGEIEDAEPGKTGKRKKGKKAKITRKAAKAAVSAKTAKAGKKALTAGGGTDKTRSRDNVFLIFSGIAKDKEIKNARVGVICKAVIGVFDGRVSDKKLRDVLMENVKTK